MHWLLASAFEVSLLAASHLVAGRFADPRDLVARLSLTLLLRIVAVAVIAAALTALGANSQAGYLAAAGLTLAAAWWLRPQATPPPEGDSGASRDDERAAAIVAVAGAALFAPVFFATANAPTDLDSWAAFEAILDWAENRRSLLDFVWHYPGTWELQYVPLVVLGGIQAMAWIPAAYAITCLALLTFDLARRCALAPALAVAFGFASISLYVFWTGPSGLWTAKNDMIYGAAAIGLLLSVIRIRNSGPTRYDTLLLALCAALLLVKYSGAVQLVVLLALSSVFLFTQRTLAPRTLAVLVASGLAVGLLTTLPSYLENAIVHGNPLYPMQISLPYLELPGHQQLSGTSILSRMGDPVVLRILFGLDPVPNRAGLAFGLVWPSALAGSLWVAARRLLQRRAPTPADLVLWAGGASIFLYFSSYWSAGFTANDLIFIQYNNPSIRYAMAGVALCEVGIAAQLFRTGPVGRTLAVSLLALQLGSRLWMFYFAFPRGPTLTAAYGVPALVGLMAGAAFATSAGIALARRFGALLGISIATAVVGVAGTWLVEARLPELPGRMAKYGVEDLIEGLDSRPRGSLRMLAAAEECTFYSFRFPLFVVEAASPIEFTRTRKAYREIGAGPLRPDRIALYHEALPQCTRLDEIQAAVESQGYRPLLVNDQAILWESTLPPEAAPPSASDATGPADDLQSR